MLDHQNLLDLILSHKLPQSVVFVVLVVLVLIFSKRLINHFFRRSLRIFSNFTMLTSSHYWLITFPPLRKVNDLQMTFKWPLRPPTKSGAISSKLYCASVCDIQKWLDTNLIFPENLLYSNLGIWQLQKKNILGHLPELYTSGNIKA